MLFEPNAILSDSLTYDITAWSLPYAYGLDAVASESKADTSSPPAENLMKASDLSQNAYAYLAEWNSFSDAQFLAELQQKNIRVRAAQKPFKMDGVAYTRGSLIITKADNKNHSDFLKKLSEIASKHHVQLNATTTGFVEGGKDFGSSAVSMVRENKIAVLSGEPTSTLQFGEIWHFFEQQLKYPITVIDTEYWKSVDLSEYDVLILPDGEGYKDFMNEDKTKRLKKWVGDGGKLIAMGDALNGLTGENKFGIKLKSVVKDTTINLQSHDDNEREQIKSAITGAIFKTKVDFTHPLAFGYDDSYFTLKLGDSAYEYLAEGTVVYLESESTQPVAGFAGSEAKKNWGDPHIRSRRSWGRKGYLHGG